MNSEPELTPSDFCRLYVSDQEEYTRMCNKDGSLKSQPQTTTFSLKNDPSRTITVENNVLYASGILFILIIISVTVLLVRRHKKKKA